MGQESDNVMLDHAIHTLVGPTFFSLHKSYFESGVDIVIFDRMKLL